jgi:hypothetical protein
MSLALLLLVYATQWLAGRLVLGALDTGLRPASGRLARALLLGPTALAVQMLLLDALGLRFSLALLLAPWWLAGGWLEWQRRRQRAGAGATIRAVPVPAPGGAWRAGALGLALLLFALTLAGGLQRPVHTTDAMNNFALVARVYATQGSLAPEAVKALTVQGHVDYPPLVALNEAALFLAGSEDPGLAIKPFFALGLLALLLLVIEACFAALRPRTAAMAAAFTMLLPLPALMAIDGYPDVLLCAAVLLLALQGRELLAAPSLRAGLLYASCVACCGLLKFEGLALALPAALLPWLACLRSKRDAGEGLRAGAATAAVALALLLCLIWPLHLARHSLGHPPGVGAAWHDLPRALERWPGVARAMLMLTAASEMEGGWVWGLFWPVAVALLLAGLLQRETRRAVALPAALLLVHLAFYVTVLALSPFDLEWHVGTAGPRFLMHVEPWALLAALAALGPARREAPA